MIFYEINKVPQTRKQNIIKAVLDAISQAEKYSELSETEMIARLKMYLRQCQFTQKQLSEVSSTLTGYTAKKLIEWGMIYEFAP